jgi:hypothetical protein
VAVAINYAVPQFVTDASGNVIQRDAAGNPLYVTRNGPKTELQIWLELSSAGYTGARDISSKIAAYDQLAQGLSPNPGATSPGTPPPASSPPAGQGAYLGPPAGTPGAASTGIPLWMWIAGGVGLWMLLGGRR